MIRSMQLSCLLIVMLAGACKERRGAEAHAVATGATGASDESATNGFSTPPADATRVRCPVCGDVCTKGPTTASAVFQGKTYYFCCPGCAPSFNKDPASYLSAAGGPGAGAGSDSSAHPATR